MSKSKRIRNPYGHWLRLYVELVDDPKVQCMPDKLFKAWINLLCVAKKNGGTLPTSEHLSFVLRLSITDTEDIISNLLTRGLLEWSWTDHKPDCVLAPHNWSARQWEYNNSTERVRRYRLKNGIRNGHQNAGNVSPRYRETPGQRLNPDSVSVLSVLPNKRTHRGNAGSDASQEVIGPTGVPSGERGRKP